MSPAAQLAPPPAPPAPPAWATAVALAVHGYALAGSMLTAAAQRSLHAMHHGQDLVAADDCARELL
jgi:hypothetical protein